jgi:hypothetical protein
MLVDLHLLSRHIQNICNGVWCLFVASLLPSPWSWNGISQEEGYFWLLGAHYIRYIFSVVWMQWNILYRYVYACMQCVWETLIACMLHCHSGDAGLFITPCACARDKVIGRGVVVVVVVVQKITTSRDLGVWATRKHNESIEFGEKLASVCFKSRDTLLTNSVFLLGIIAMPIDRPTQYIIPMISAHAHN